MTNHLSYEQEVVDHSQGDTAVWSVASCTLSPLQGGTDLLREGLTFPGWTLHWQYHRVGMHADMLAVLQHLDIHLN